MECTGPDKRKKKIHLKVRVCANIFYSCCKYRFFEEVVSCRKELVGSIKGTSIDGAIEAAEIERLVPEKNITNTLS